MIVRKMLGWKNLALLLALTSFTSHLSAAIAQTRSTAIAERGNSGVVYVRRTLSGAPPGGIYRGGGTRGAKAEGGDSTTGTSRCATPDSLTALVPFEATYKSVTVNGCPLSRVVKQNVWGHTVSERPTFWVYVPYSSTATSAKFSIDTEEVSPQTIYTTTVALPKQSGIMAIRLPKTASALQPDKRYKWIFSVESKDTAANFVEAFVVRELLPPAIASQLTPTPSIQNAAVYAKNGFWYDALTTLADLRQQRPQDAAVTEAWQELLTGVATSEEARRDFNVEQIAAQLLLK